MEIFTSAIAAALGNLGSAAVLGAYQAVKTLVLQSSGVGSHPAAHHQHGAVRESAVHAALHGRALSAAHGHAAFPDRAAQAGNSIITPQRRSIMMITRDCLKAAACALALFGLLAGCSEEKKEEESKGMIEQAADEVAHKAVEQMTKPIDKANASQALQNAQNQRMKEMAEEAESGN